MQRLLFSIAMILTLAGTIFVVIAKNPEEKIVTSDDSFVTLAAHVLATETLAIDVVPDSADKPYTAVLGRVYQLYPAGKMLTNPATLTFSYGDLSNSEALALHVGYFDEAFQMWRTVETMLNTSKREASAQMTKFSEWALLQLDDVARPNFDQEIEALISASPEGAVGYQLEVGYSDVPGDFVMLNGAGKSGGCGGQYRRGTSTQMTSTGDVFSDSLEYQIVAVWEMGRGCGDKVVIE